MTPQEARALADRLRSATEGMTAGPWKAGFGIDGSGYTIVCGSCNEYGCLCVKADKSGIVALRNSLPDILAALDALADAAALAVPEAEARQAGAREALTALRERMVRESQWRAFKWTQAREASE